MAGILDGINSRFPPKRQPETPSREESPPPPGDAPVKYVVYRFEELGDTLVVVVFDAGARAEVKRRFDGHALWFAKELIYFMERYVRWDRGRWVRSMAETDESDVSTLTELFIAACRVKRVFAASIYRNNEPTQHGFPK